MEAVELSKKKQIILTVIILLVLILGGFFAVKVILIYSKIMNGELGMGGYDFEEQMSIGQAIANVEPDIDPTLVASDDDPALGAEEPVLTIVEFADFQCPHCAAVSGTVRRMASLYGEKVRFIYRDYPVSEIHPDAQLAAEAAECAHDQGLFWQYHDKLFANQGDLDVVSLKSYAIQVGLDPTVFNQCLDYSSKRGEVLDDYTDGSLVGVYGTPTFFFNGSRVSGAIPEAVFESIIQGFLE